MSVKERTAPAPTHTNIVSDDILADFSVFSYSFQTAMTIQTTNISVFEDLVLTTAEL